MWERFLSERARLAAPSAVRELFRWAGSDVISFSGGMPDPATFPAEELLEIISDVLRERPQSALQYSLTEGIYELRDEIARLSRAHAGINAGPENVLVTVGSQEAIELVARLFIDPGDAVAVENPTYVAALQSWRAYAPRFVGVPLDERGMAVEALEERLRRLRAEGIRVKLVYTIPTAHNPCGVTMPLERRKRLLEIADEYDLVIVEDDPYSYLLFEGPAEPPLKSLDRSGRVIYLSTVSKFLAPGLRIGWVVASEEVISWLAAAKQALSLCTPSLMQYVVAESLRRGLALRQIERVRELYRRKRDAMLAALRDYMPDGTSWTRPRGGMFVWVTVPRGVDTRRLLDVSLRRYRVAFTPGHYFFVERPASNTMRLNFTYPSVEQIEGGVRRLSLALRELIEGAPNV